MAAESGEGPQEMMEGERPPAGPARGEGPAARLGLTFGAGAAGPRARARRWGRTRRRGAQGRAAPGGQGDRVRAASPPCPHHRPLIVRPVGASRGFADPSQAAASRALEGLVGRGAALLETRVEVASPLCAF